MLPRWEYRKGIEGPGRVHYEELPEVLGSATDAQPFRTELHSSRDAAKPQQWQGMSMGSMAFEMMTTQGAKSAKHHAQRLSKILTEVSIACLRSEDTEEFKELSKEYQSGYGVKNLAVQDKQHKVSSVLILHHKVPFLNLSFRKITAATRDVCSPQGQVLHVVCLSTE